MGRSGQRKRSAPARRVIAEWEIDQQQAFVEQDGLRDRFSARLATLDTERLAAEHALDLAVLLALDLAGLPVEEASRWDARRGGRRWERYPDMARAQEPHVPCDVEHRGRTITLDEGIAPLIEACWSNEISTVMSCEENFGGRAWIQFASLSDCYRFVQQADSTEAADAYVAEIVEALTPGPQRTFEPELAWWPTFEIRWQDEGWVVRSSIRFPADQIGRLTEQLAVRELAA